MKHTITGWITSTQFSMDGKPTIDFSTYKPGGKYGSEYTVAVKEFSFDVEVPDDFDPRQAMVEILKEKRTAILAEAQMEIKKLDDKIQDILALEHK